MFHGRGSEMGLSTPCPQRLFGWRGTGTMDKAWTTPPVPCHARRLRRIRSVDGGPRVVQARQSECQRSTLRFSMSSAGRSRRRSGRCARASAGSTARHRRRTCAGSPARMKRAMFCFAGMVRASARSRTTPQPAPGSRRERSLNPFAPQGAAAAGGVVHALSSAPVLRHLARLGKGWATPHRP